jgi:DUF1016 N-terminal domain/Virulence protein RhuM family
MGIGAWRWLMFNQKNNKNMDHNQLIFYTTPQGHVRVEMLYSEETFWLTQKAIAQLFGVEVPAISKHLRNIYESGELEKEATVSILEVVQLEGKRNVTRKREYYRLEAIIAVGFRINSAEATQFRIWATQTLGEQHNTRVVPTKTQIQLSDNQILEDIVGMIEATKRSVSHTINAGLTLLYWRIGTRINSEILEGQRAEYGKRILPTLSAKLVAEYGNGYSERSLKRMIDFASKFPDAQYVAQLAKQLSWSHFICILTLKDALQMEFYAQMCRIENWSVRTLEKKIDSMLLSAPPSPKNRKSWPRWN